jgi:hypothetical protein
MPMTPEVQKKWTEAWAEARKAKDQRRKENREKWSKRRDWSEDNEATPAIPIPDDPIDDGSQASISGSLAEMRAIMLDASKPLYRRLDAAEIVLSFELGPAAGVGIDPDQIAASAYKFLKVVAKAPQTPEALKFRALKSLVGIENARVAARSGTEANIAKRQLVLNLVNAERLRLFREAGLWRDIVSKSLTQKPAA